MSQNEKQQNEFQTYRGGKGIFYGVIAVATLIVAIIGATFAYFTASANSTENALAARAAKVSVDYTEGRTIKATNLIPATADVVAAAYAQPTADQLNESAGCTVDPLTGVTTACTDVKASYDTETGVVTKGGDNDWVQRVEGDANTKCVDDNGYFVCAIYEFKVTNSSNVQQSVTAYMTINENSFTTTDSSGNLALKFMTVRTDNEIDVNAVTGVTDSAPCWHASVFQTVASAQTGGGIKNAAFCDSSNNPDTLYDSSYNDDYTNRVPLSTTAQYGTTATDGYFTTTNFSGNNFKGAAYPEAASFYNISQAGAYYFYNTTAVRQSVDAVGQNQTLFTGDLLPAIATANLEEGTGKVVDETCSTDLDPDGNCPGLNAPGADGDRDENGRIGAYGEVTNTYYVVVWLEETLDNQNTDQEKGFSATINVTAGDTYKINDKDVEGVVSGEVGTENILSQG